MSYIRTIYQDWHLESWVKVVMYQILPDDECFEGSFSTTLVPFLSLERVDVNDADVVPLVVTDGALVFVGWQRFESSSSVVKASWINKQNYVSKYCSHMSFFKCSIGLEFGQGTSKQVTCVTFGPIFG